MTTKAATMFSEHNYNEEDINEEAALPNPTQHMIAGKNLDTLYEMNCKEQVKNLLTEGNIFGITLFVDGATIKWVPLLIVLAAGVKNHFALLDIVNCTNHVAKGGMKDASYITDIITLLIALLEWEVDEHKWKCTGIIDLVFLIVQVMCKKLQNYWGWKLPCITVGHGAEHVSLFFSDVYKKASNIRERTPVSFFRQCKHLTTMHNLLKGTWVSGYVHVAATSGDLCTTNHQQCFKKYSREHNNGIPLGFIKLSECRMAGEHMTLQCLLRICNALKATVTSKEFMDLIAFRDARDIVMCDEFWKYLFVLCHLLF